MTRKDFEVIAAALKGSRPARPRDPIHCVSFSAHTLRHTVLRRVRLQDHGGQRSPIVLTITIDTDNAAFQLDLASELARILLRAGADLHCSLRAYPGEDIDFPLIDFNGNHVGRCTLESS